MARRARIRRATPLTTALATGLAGLLALAAAGPTQVAARPAADADRAALALRSATVSAALAALRDNAHVLGLGAADRFTVTDVINDPNGAAHVRMDRTYHGLPVLGGDFVVHRAADGRWTGADATLYDALTLGITPKITAAAAAAAVAATPARAPALVVHAYDGAPRLAWDVFTVGMQPDGQTPSRLHTYVDALDGSVLSRSEQIFTAAGEGHSLYVGKVKLDTSPLDDVFELRDSTRGGGYTADAENRTDDCLPVIISLCTSTAPATVFTDEDNKWGSGDNSDRQSAAVDAQYGSDTTWDYFQDAHSRLGVANNKVGVYSRVHYGRKYGNAFWNDDCSCMTFGDGDGKELGPMVSLDIAAHEITHGVISNTAKLRPSGEAGGLNEATADIFAVMIEFTADNPKDPADYFVGETVFLKKFDKNGKRNAIRFLDKPSRDGASPDCWTPGARSLDIHLTAGLGGHFFYMLAEGSGKKTINGVTYNSPTCNGKKVSGIGRTAAAKIWYRALTTYMTSDTDYSGARSATLKAAKEIYGAGSTQAAAVTAAWEAVNVEPDKDADRGAF